MSKKKKKRLSIGQILLLIALLSLIIFIILVINEITGIVISINFTVFLGSLAVRLVLEGIKSFKKSAQQEFEFKRRIENLKNKYLSSLDKLAKNPTDQKLRLACQDLGREYYGFKMPDTFTGHYKGLVLVGTSNHQNNAANREAMINSDIEARIGHLKVKV